MDIIVNKGSHHVLKTQVKIIKASDFKNELVPAGARVEVGILKGEEVVKITYSYS